MFSSQQNKIFWSYSKTRRLVNGKGEIKMFHESMIFRLFAITIKKNSIPQKKKKKENGFSLAVRGLRFQLQVFKQAFKQKVRLFGE